VFQSLKANAADQGLCAAVTVAALAEIIMPQEFSRGFSTACLPPSADCPGTREYTFCDPGQPVGPSCNSLLDVLIGGCKVFPGLCLTAIEITQPDVGTDGQPPAEITLGPNNKAQFSQPNDAYSFHLRFTANRAHITNNLK
jgi:hypothetical protein